MDISYYSRKMQRVCSDARAMSDTWGTAVARKLMLRLTEMEAAVSLDDLRRLPQTRCQLLELARGRLAVFLTDPRRLIFDVDHDPLPTRAGESLDWALVTRVRVLEVASSTELTNHGGKGHVEEAIRT
jgi:hypothetical protein